jgi:GDPmannose 4,6-dehydratase
MWLMLQQEKPDDYVISSGVSRSVRDFVQPAFSLVGLDWKKYVEIDKAYMPPADVAELRGDSSKAAEKLGWHPATSFDEMVHEMLEHDLKLVEVDPSKYVRHPPARVEPASSCLVPGCERSPVRCHARGS